MQSLSSLLKRIQRDFAAYGFVLGDDFKWSPSERTVTYKKPGSLTDIWTLLHELGHAELGHQQYESDVALVRIETAAWEHAATVLAPKYDLTIDDDHIQDYLDTYRFWLHERSTCPNCGQNGFQATKNTYSCMNCKCLWRVNEARMCRLKRTRLPSRSRSA